jgi:hypothetical protein
MPHLTGWLAGGSTTASRPAQSATSNAPVSQPAAAIQTPQAAGGAASVQLAAHHVTPQSHLDVTASGFMSRESLVVTIADAQGNSYAQQTLIAGKDGRLAHSSVALPAGLESGNYQVLVVGSLSHRTASSTFVMHDVPPLVTLGTYTATPGQDIGFAGSGFLPSEQVKVYLGPTTSVPLTSVQATDTGAVKGSVHVPAMAPGTYSLTLVGATSQIPVAVGVGIQGFKPWVVLDHYALASGDHLGFVGHGFAPGEQVFVYLNSPRGQPALHVTADTSGQITGQDTWTPNAATGDNMLTFVGQTSKATTTATFTVLPPPPSAAATTPTTP